jgi:hypothetical protein
MSIKAAQIPGVRGSGSPRGARSPPPLTSTICQSREHSRFRAVSARPAGCHLPWEGAGSASVLAEEAG